MVGCVTASLFMPWPSLAQTIDAKLWTTNDFGAVRSIARSGNTIYIGGSFTEVGPCTGHGVPVSSATGAPAAVYPRVGGEVDAVVADGHGGWFVGGTFTSVAGRARPFLARIGSDGSLSPWNPEPDAPVAALCLTNDTLYVGGSFTSCGGVARCCGAAFDVRTGHLTDWDPVANAPIAAMAADDAAIYLGGRFSALDTAQRANLGAVDRFSGAAIPWNPGADSVVLALAVSGNEIYAGGYFHQVGGQARSLMAAIDRSSGTVLPWSWAIARNPACDGCDPGPFVDAIAVDGAHLYFGGSFTHVDSVPRSGVAALTLTSHQLSDWDAGLFGVAPLPYCRSLAINQGIVYIGGRFDGLKGLSRPYAGAVDTSGVLAGWNPRPDVSVRCVAVAGASAYIGGEFTSVWNWQPRRFLAALDAKTGEATAWNPSPNNVVGPIRVSGSTVYVSGAFDTIAAQPRTCLAAIDAVSGAATPWNPGVEAGIYPPVWDMVVRHGTVYVGGFFSGLGGQLRYCIGAVDSTTGQATPWYPQVDDLVETMGMRGDTLYLGGWFSQVAGQPRNYLAAVDTGGAVLDWNPDPNSIVQAMTVAEDRVFIGGGFSYVGGLPRRELAAIDCGTGTVTDWVADADPQVRCLAVANHVLYAGGWFTNVGGESRSGLAAIDTQTGAVLPWDPQPNGPVSSLLASGDALYVGGPFDYLGLRLQPGLASLSLARGADPGPLPQHGHVLAVAQNAPNPVRTSTVIRFGLSIPAHVTMSVFDLAGRCIATPLREAEQVAGSHQVELQATSWPPGVYYYRFQAAGATAVRKMVVMK
jgi:trimeric autotransporter adhesin